MSTLVACSTMHGRYIKEENHGMESSKLFVAIVEALAYVIISVNHAWTECQCRHETRFLTVSASKYFMPLAIAFLKQIWISYAFSFCRLIILPFMRRSLRLWHVHVPDCSKKIQLKFWQFKLDYQKHGLFISFGFLNLLSDHYLR